MMNLRKLAMVLGAVAGIVTISGYASAQATRTWVSGVGNDANPCSRTAPCKTFAGAITKTATNGEINCLDPGGFGGVTITKGLSIVCNYTEGGVLSAGAGVNGIVVNAPATSHVYLRGLDMHGAGSAQNGLRVIAGASVTMEDSVIRAYNASNGLGISFQPSAATALTLNNVTVDNNGTGATGGGILIQPTGAGGSARVVMNNVRVTNNANIGLRMDSTGNTSATGNRITISNSMFCGSPTGIQIKTVLGNSFVEAMLNHSTVCDNTTGISADGSAAVIRVSDTAITANTAGLNTANGGQIKSYGDNLLDGNTNPTSFTLPNIPKV